MKVLSVKNPFAYMIAYGIKDVENRTWKTDFRGRFLIHTSGLSMLDILDKFYPKKILQLCDQYWKSFDAGKLKDAEKILKENIVLQRIAKLDEVIELYSNKKEIYVKCQQIIGSVELIDIVKNSKSPFAEKNCYHWILENPVLFENPVTNIKGKLNLWDHDLQEFDPVSK